jgi:hypothetical protein
MTNHFKQIFENLNQHPEQPTPEAPETDAKKLIAHVEKKHLLVSYDKMDSFFRCNVMDNKDFTDQELYDTIYKKMWESETTRYDIFFLPTQQPFTGVPRPELVELFNQNGFDIVADIFDDRVVIKPISHEIF